MAGWYAKFLLNFLRPCFQMGHHVELALSEWMEATFPRLISMIKQACQAEDKVGLAHGTRAHA